MRIHVLDEFAARFSAIAANTGSTPSDLANLTLESIQLAFEQDGLRFSRFLEDGGPEDSAPFVSDSLRATLDSAGLTGETRQNAAEAIGVVLRLSLIHI